MLTYDTLGNTVSVQINKIQLLLSQFLKLDFKRESPQTSALDLVFTSFHKLNGGLNETTNRHRKRAGSELADTLSS